MVVVVVVVMLEALVEEDIGILPNAM